VGVSKLNFVHMNQFGRIFKVSIFGESHGPMVGVVLDGIKPGIPLTETDFFPMLQRRRGGVLAGTTPRQETDHPIFLSGVFQGKTTGAPLTIGFENKNTDPKSYDQLIDTPRPGHADFVARTKFGGYNDFRGGGHFSGRLTVGLVAAGVVAHKQITFLHQSEKSISIESKILELGGISDLDQAVEQAVHDQDSIGGLIECRVKNLPIGYGEPFFDSLESMISHAVFSIPAIKGIEFGSGFAAAKMRGSQHNDSFIDVSGKTNTNHAGGIAGGISNGNELVFRIAVKPTSSTPSAQQTLNLKTNQMEKVSVSGRHDLCIALRVPPVLEAVTAIVLADAQLLSK
jgi:chorismate synthase